ncbi:uncharacterized protein BDR25DRAFT_224441, partial [Lindgomyces ingoldianus]
CTSTTSVVNYIGVYALKGKTQTQTFKDIAGQILLYIKPSNLMLSFIVRLFNKSISSCNYSA